MKKTKQNYEEFLNNNSHSTEELLHGQSNYLIKTHHDIVLAHECKFGTLLRKNDPIAFEVGYREWKR